MRRFAGLLLLIASVACGSNDDAGDEDACRACSRKGQLCEAGACVDPWRYGSPSFDQCADEPKKTPESLAQKTERFEGFAKRLHVNPQLKWMTDVDLAPGSDPETATYADVPAWETGPNDGLWSALYLTAEAYRWSVTKDPAALEMLRMLMDGEVLRMRVTGVPGNFTRALVPPNVQRIACPTNNLDYVPDPEKNDDKWVKIGGDGCVQTFDPVAQKFVSSTHCGLDAYAGTCWLDDVSQDEYAGHMLALGAVSKLVDDPGIQADVKDLLGQVGHHLVDHQMQFVDWDGRVTEHGRIYAGLIATGFQSAMSLAFMKIAAVGSGDAELSSYYDDCLLKKNGPNDCIQHLGANQEPYDTLLQPSALYLGCKSNWNDFSMHMLSLQDLAWFETDPTVHAEVQAALLDDIWNPPDQQRPLSEQNNTYFDFIYAAGKPLGPKSDGPAYDAVKNGICMLRQFPATKVATTTVSCSASECLEVCKDRFGEPMSDYPRPIAERCLTRFVWWGSPYGLDDCAANPTRVYSPADYLLAYWMGRYYGFIDPAS